MNTIAETTIEADPKVPVIRMSRDFTATPEQLFRAHTDPELFAQWVGPRSLQTRVTEWDARSGGSWRYVSTRDGEEYAFRGCFHEVRPDRIVQTFTYEGQPDSVIGTKVSNCSSSGRWRPSWYVPAFERTLTVWPSNACPIHRSSAAMTLVSSPWAVE